MSVFFKLDRQTDAIIYLMREMRREVGKKTTKNEMDNHSFL